MDVRLPKYRFCEVDWSIDPNPSKFSHCCGRSAFSVRSDLCWAWVWTYMIWLSCNVRNHWSTWKWAMWLRRMCEPTNNVSKTSQWQYKMRLLTSRVMLTFLYCSSSHPRHSLTVICRAFLYAFNWLQNLAKKMMVITTNHAHAKHIDQKLCRPLGHGQTAHL